MKSKWRAALLLFGLSGLVIWGALGGSHHGTRSVPNETVIRFHVVANSDGADDQKLKLLVRDQVLQAIGPQLERAHSPAEAWYILDANRELMKVSAENTIRAHGYAYPVKVEMGNWQFPTRYYGDLVLPAGSYEAVRISIGSGKGQNWWCVIFPPLCLVDIAGGVSEKPAPASTTDESVNVTTGQSSPISEQDRPDFTVKFKLWDWLQASAQHLEQVLGWQLSPDRQGYQE